MNKTQQNWLSETKGLWGIDKTVAKTGLKRAQVKQDLQGVEAYQRTKEQRHRDKQFHRIVARPREEGRDDCWQGDLIDIEPTKRGQSLNKGVRFLCVFIDVYSRKIWAAGIKRKSTEEIMKYAGPLLRKYKPKNLTYDRESAIKSNKMKSLLTQLEIKLWHPAREPEMKRIPGVTAIIERVNRTIRKLITRWKVAFKNKAWIDSLPRLVSNYNTTPHGAFRNLAKDQRSPNLVYKNQNAKQLIPREVKTYGIGDSVRVRLPRRMFEKRSLPEWSREIYTVSGAQKYKYVVRDSKRNTATLGSKDLQPATESFSVRRSARGRAVDNLPGPSKVFSLLSGNHLQSK